MAGIETNPGPYSKNLSFAVWNLDSLPARDFARVPLIESFQAAYNFDLFGICESALTKEIGNDDIRIEVFHLIQFEQIKQTTPGMEASVFIFVKTYLSNLDPTLSPYPRQL